eukprot:1722209-Amphidinium_carterae.1
MVSFCSLRASLSLQGVGKEAWLSNSFRCTVCVPVRQSSIAALKKVESCEQTEEKDAAKSAPLADADL